MSLFIFTDSIALDGPGLRLRLIRPNDSEYVYQLRTNPGLNVYLSQVTGTVVDQKTWIERYKVREVAGDEWYFVIERRDGTRCGLVRIYDLTPETFTWGSWVLDANKPSKAALESIYLVCEFGFSHLKRRKAIIEVRKGNEKSLTFQRRFGAKETHYTEDNIYFEYLSTQFVKDKVRFQAVLGIPT